MEHAGYELAGSVAGFLQPQAVPLARREGRPEVVTRQRRARRGEVVVSVVPFAEQALQPLR